MRVRRRVRRERAVLACCALASGMSAGGGSLRMR